jgi:hypothetical protein
MRISRSLLKTAAFMAAFLLAEALVWLVPEPTHATIPTTSNSITVAGNGSQTVFSFPFVGAAASDIIVLYTDASGNQTTLTQGPGSTQYQVSLNAAVPPALWGVGGTVTYNPAGAPIASGAKLTITRTLPVQQQISLQNQASYGAYAQVAEQAIDLQNMQLQQVAGAIGRAIVGNPANSAAPLPLPPAAQAANQGLCFDSTGNNVIGCAGIPIATVSVAMQPVVAASTIPAAVTLLGLGGNVAANTWNGNATSSTAAPANNAWTDCHSANSGVTYTNGTGTGCNTALASLTQADQTISGGGNVTSLSLTTSGSVTIDCGARPLQFITNNGAWTLTAPANDGSCILLVTNGASAGAITFSGFSVGASTGDALTTTNTSKFSISIWRINGTAGYRVAAHQ